MPFPRKLAEAQRESVHGALVEHYRNLAEIRLNLSEPAHLFAMTAGDAAKVRDLLGQALEPLQAAERIVRP